METCCHCYSECVVVVVGGGAKEEAGDIRSSLHFLPPLLHLFPSLLHHLHLVGVDGGWLMQMEFNI